jgi:hypothetical protein
MIFLTSLECYSNDNGKTVIIEYRHSMDGHKIIFNLDNLEGHISRKRNKEVAKILAEQLTPKTVNMIRARIREYYN